MASNTYTPYGHTYQQSSAQQYTPYQTAPAANHSAQSMRQYQQPAATQAQDYMSYPAQSYPAQGGGYAAGQDGSWHNNAYGGTRETTNRAAEVLRNMSNTQYTPNSTSATNQGSFTATHSVSQSNRYPMGTSNSPHMHTQSHPTQASRSHNVNNSQAKTMTNQTLPSATAYPSQRVQTLHNDQQRSASPAQQQYHATSSNSARNSTTASTTSQIYHDYNARQLPSVVEAPRNNQNISSSTSYNYTTNTMPPAPVAAPVSTTSVSGMYNEQGATTVDPTAVYDPWVEWRRKQEVLEARKAAEDAARAEEERKAEEKRLEEQKRKEEEEERLKEPAPKPKPKKSQNKQSNPVEAASATSGPPAASGEALEAEIRAMMAKMRELNNKDPALLARIWEEERKTKGPKSPTVNSNKAAPQAQPVQAAQVAQAPTPKAADPKKKMKVAEPVNRNVAKSTPAPSAPAVKSTTRPATSRPGHTIWPPEKKAHLANAAVAYLHGLNFGHSINSSQILAMLEGNPSYIELCELLERQGLKLDRAQFAKNLLTAVPDVNSAARRSSLQAPSTAKNKPQVPPAIMKAEVATPLGVGSHVAVASPANATTSAPVAEMVPIKAELKPPANKAEAARKRNLSDLVDLTQLSDEDDRPAPKKLNARSTYAYQSPYPPTQDTMMVDHEPKINNFPTTSVPNLQAPATLPTPPVELRRTDYVELLDKKKALRRNTYNPATIARDVLLACGRHPTERQLNQHLDSLRTTLSQVGFDSDLSTIRWDILDPGKPPPGYFQLGVQAVTEDADDEDDSDEEERAPGVRSSSKGISSESGAQARVQALPEGINPFKGKKRGRPPRHSLPSSALPETPKRSPGLTDMSASAPRPTSTSAGVGYSAFRSATQYGPNGEPLPKKRGRPVGWRKAIHGSPAAYAQSASNGYTGPSKEKPSQPSSFRKVRAEDNEPIVIGSRSPSVANHVPHYQSYKCEWRNCESELHNLETLKKHVFKVHRNTSPQDSHECLWGDCGKQVKSTDPMTHTRVEQYTPYFFYDESFWRAHIQQLHFDPLSWKLGDGPASGLSDTQDSDAYLSDAQGRQVTPRITVQPKNPEDDDAVPKSLLSAPRGRGRGRTQKKTAEQEARETQNRLIWQKKRTGGPGMDRGGATLVNDECRRGLKDTLEIEEEFVDVED